MSVQVPKKVLFAWTFDLCVILRPIKTHVGALEIRLQKMERFFIERKQA